MLAGNERVLVRVPSWLGDAVMAEPAIAALAQRVGSERISLAGSAPLTGLLASGMPGCDRVAADDVGAWRGHDLALLFTNSFRSAWCAWRAGIPQRVGWSRDGRGLLLTHTARPAREAGKAPVRIGRPGRWPRPLPRPFGSDCVELLGLVGVGVGRTRPSLYVDPEARAAREARRAELGLAGRPYVVANVGSRWGSAKGYPPELWARVLDGLDELRVVLVCGPGEEQVLGAVRQAARADHAALVDPVVDLAQLCAWIEGAELLLTADSGPRHLAVATGTPAVVVSGPTDPRHTADHLGGTVLLREPVECGPCHLELCPEGGAAHHACMRRVAPDRLASAALGILAASR